MKIEELRVAAYTVPTDAPESDGTLCWDQTTLVLVQARSGTTTGIGYTYADTGTARLIQDLLAPAVLGMDPMHIPEAWGKMIALVRNLGCKGPGAMAISAVDNALWDLKAKLCSLPLVSLLGACRKTLPIYGSGGFTSYSKEQLQRQLGGWAEQGLTRVKMKVGRHPGLDLQRVHAAREAVGNNVELFVDANSAYSRKQALYYMKLFAGECDVRWMEQPLAPEDRAGMRWLREHGPARMELADGEYGYGLSSFREMMDGVDVVMADATRCCGITGFLKVGALCEAFHLPLSAHCAPLLHLHPCCALPAVRHAEYFHDHVRIERLFFDGVPEPVHGELAPNFSAPGLGIAFRPEAAEPFRQSF
ncbi:MAG: mandelate racemase [Verrucomicrobia bacterium]|nr:mandelate racemase [Verrucomicrobiota bacterium]